MNVIFAWKFAASESQGIADTGHQHCCCAAVLFDAGWAPAAKRLPSMRLLLFIHHVSKVSEKVLGACIDCGGSNSLRMSSNDVHPMCIPAL